MRHCSNLRRGFSLIELLTAMAVSGVLVGSMGVVLIMASSALERGTGPIDDERVAAEALADLQSDLAEATRFFRRDSRGVWFEVPDRDKDGVPEHILYEWSGVAGAPLTRSTNGAASGIVAADVRSLDFTYIIRPGLSQAVSTERLIAEFTSHVAGVSGSTTVTPTNWVAQVLRPAFTADTVSWKATKVRLRMRVNSPADGVFLVSLVAVGADNRPGSTVHASTELKESTLAGVMRTDDILFASCDPIPAGQAVAIVIKGVSGGNACDVGFLSSATPTMPFNLWRATSTTSGASWQGFGQSQNNIFEVHGTVTTQSR